MTKLTAEERNALPAGAFAFPVEREMPLISTGHVRDALARFDQVEGVTDAERDEAWERILVAAKRFGIEVRDREWQELFIRAGRPIPSG